MSASLATRNLLRRLALPLIGLLLQAFPACATAQEGLARVWLLLSETGGAYTETSRTVLAGLPRGVDSQVIVYTGNEETWAQGLRSSDLVVPLGLKASKAALQLDRPPQILAALLPRQAYDSLTGNGTAAATRRSFSALILDQPFERQMALARLALPKADKLGVILGRPSAGLKAELAKAASQAGLRLHAELAENADELFTGQRELLRDNDALLAIPDSSVLNQTTLMSYLITAYRARVPVLGFSPSLVEAGALAAVYSTPDQIGRQLAEIIADMANGKPFKAGRLIYPRYFKVYVNRQVARSLELDIPSDEWLYKQIEARPGAAP